MFSLLFSTFLFACFRLFPASFDPLLLHLDDNMWLRRAAIIHQLNYKEAADEVLLFEFCLRRCHEEEFFIRKAIGWALRQHARVAPAKIKKFAKDNKDRLSKLSYDQAMKHLGK